MPALITSVLSVKTRHTSLKDVQELRDSQGAACGSRGAASVWSGSQQQQPANSCKPHLLQVVVRCRPLNDKEHADGRQRIVDVDARQGQIQVTRCACCGLYSTAPGLKQCKAHAL